MLPIGPLMIEHRLTERMVALLKNEGDRIEQEKNIRRKFLDTAVDFFKTYADRCHHGKEEEILLKGLAGKTISSEHKRLMEEILEEHRQSRTAVMELEDAEARYLKGEREALSEIAGNIRILVGLYPCHIDKEDHHFFLPCMEYFNQEEKDAMLQQEYEFDRSLIHQLYKERVTAEEARFGKM